LNYKFQEKFQFETSLNFKGFKSFGKNPINSPKLFLNMIFNTKNLDCLTCIKKFEVPLQVATGTLKGKFKRVQI
jgi:hypothetical protein